MTYDGIIITLVVMLLLSMVWMYATRGDKKIFTGKLVGLAARTVATATLFALIGLLYRQPGNYIGLVGLQALLFLAFALFAWWYWHKQRLSELDARAIWRWELPQASALWALATLVLLSALLAKRLVFPGDPAGMADGVPLAYAAAASLALLVPPAVLQAYRRWNAIPIVIKYREPWMLPVHRDAPVIEPSADALRIFFEVPVREGDSDTVSYDLSIPRRTSLGQAFHHLLYQHNVQRRSAKQIAIAFENKSDFLYGWLLYRSARSWWGSYRDYLPMEEPLRTTDLKDGERILAERVRVWENKT
ncbi:TssN family type VI secretion system protein [Lewinella sp. IMCC34191]|uniref:TssN family type VI secretion system protein n=1 Tax=Lewinella sp. IMCC34191 TaxID=2259172 RepID=UPI000E23ABE6|nr:TssN family type VI secretion system protein [Lewinella sp. IMCC34191]